MYPAVDVQPGLVSVMMPVHNAEVYVGLAIESLRAQTYLHWELVVVDDGSTDQTAAVIARLVCGKVSQTSPLKKSYPLSGRVSTSPVSHTRHS